METPIMNRVRVLFLDQLNLARGKYVPKDFAEDGVVRFCKGAYAVTYNKDIVAVPGADVELGLPDVEALFDPETLRDSWEDNTKIAIAEIHEDGEPSGLCGRGALKRAIDKWQAKGLTPMIGFEGEAYIFEKGADGSWVPYNTPGSYVYGTGPFTDPEGLIDEIWAIAQKLGIQIESFNAEFDAPQFELTMRYSNALKACDDFFLFRLMAREVLYRKGYLLSFMPKPIKDLSGSGLHVNFSFLDKDGNNAFANGTGIGALSDLVAGCISGLLHHHESLTPILAPVVNSYERLKPANMSGYWANWGHDHRGVAVRVSGETGRAARLEHRVGDGAASPYLTVAAILNAALLGVENKYDLPDAETNDGMETVNTNRHAPDTLKEALDWLKKDSALTAEIGDLIIANYIGIKDAEIAETSELTEQELRDYYINYL